MRHEIQLVPAGMEDRFRAAPRARLEKGDGLIINGVWHAYLGSDQEGVRARVMDDTGVERKLSHWEFFSLFYANRLEIRRRALGCVPAVIVEGIRRPVQAYKPTEIDEGLRRLQYVQLARRLQRSGTIKRRLEGYERAARAGAKLRRRRLARERGVPVTQLGLESVSGSALRQWYVRWEASGHMFAALIPQDWKKGNRKMRLDGAVVAVIREFVETRYLVNARPPLTLAHVAICARIMELNEGRKAHERLSEPDIRTVRSWIDRNYDEFTVISRRWDVETAIQKLGQVRRGPVGAWPMHTVQIDYARLDVFAVTNSGDPLFGTIERSRPWIVAAICTLTNMIVGFYLTFEPPSWVSVMQCLRHMVLPKDVSGIPGLQSPYPCLGTCEVLQMDNERCFRSRSMAVTTASLKIEPDYGPAGKSRIRGKIERFFREVNHGFLALTPGRSFQNPVARGDYDSEGLATFTLDELTRRITLWIVDVYHNRPNGGLLGMTPLQAWDALKELGVGLPAKVTDLDALLSMTVERTVQREGVRFLGLRYTSRELGDFLRRRRGTGRKYLVKIDPQDLVQVMIFDDEPDQERWVYLRCTTPELVEGRDLRWWKRFCRLARRRNKGNAPGRVIALETQKLLDDEAARRSSARETLVEAAEIEWFVQNLDNPLFDLAVEDSGGRRRRGDADSVPLGDAELLVAEGPVRLLEAPSIVADLAGEGPQAPGNEAGFDFDDPDNWEK